jgi:hypothetical protein
MASALSSAGIHPQPLSLSAIHRRHVLWHMILHLQPAPDVGHQMLSSITAMLRS